MTPEAPESRSPDIPATLLAFLNEHRHLAIVSHVEPDGDCLASSLAFASYLRRVHGHDARCFCAGPFVRREIAHYEREFEPRIPQEFFREHPDAAVVILDCSGPDRVGAIEPDIQGVPTAVIDHHATNEPYGDARFVVTNAAATCYLVQLVAEAMGGQLTRDEAQLLLFGICTDTGYFRHVEADAADLFAAVGRLMSAGASPKDAHAQMFGGHTFESRKLLATLITRAVLIADGAGVVTWETLDDVQAYGKQSRDSDTLYQLLFAIDGVRFAALVREESPAMVSGSLRSIDTIDVSVIAKSFGGGGHKRAAGFTSNNSLESVIANVRERAEAALGREPATPATPPTTDPPKT